MERCGFFDANLVGEEYDRVYLSAQFAAYFASFIGNGVFGGKSDELEIVAMATPSMQVTASSGQGWINGYWYENADDLYLPIDVADGVLNRIDSVVLRLGFSERTMWVAVKKGTATKYPVAPTLTRSADYYELQLATIRINAGAVNIKQSDITDYRLDATVCGLVCGLVQQFDTTAFGRQLQTFIDEYIAQANEDYATYLSTLDNLKSLAQAAYQAYLVFINNLKTQGTGAYEDYLVWLGNLKTASTTQINALLDELRGLISTEVASALSLRIDALEDEVPNTQIAQVEHNLGSYIHCDLYEFNYGAGVQTAGEGPAGGGPLTSIPAEYTMSDMNNIIIKTKEGYGVVEAVNKLSNNIYVVVFMESLTSILLVLRN